MYLTELIAYKDLIKKKLIEVEKCLSDSQSEDLANEYNILLDQLKNKLITIDSANNKSSLNLGGVDISISVAVIIRDSIKEKIDMFTNLINNPNCRLNKIDLMHQRDKHFDDYILLVMGIQKNDLNIIIGQ